MFLLLFTSFEVSNIFSGIALAVVKIVTRLKSNHQIKKILYPYTKRSKDPFTPLLNVFFKN